jgi:hypothetical protein
MEARDEVSPRIETSREPDGALVNRSLQPEPFIQLTDQNQPASEVTRDP